ncbi:MAG: M23 family metallopeptidase, partial [Rubricoccaceae bacterium]|nr:M23 family metallopeptidase [Rubricoccaceae bacterium]
MRWKLLLVFCLFASVGTSAQERSNGRSHSARPLLFPTENTSVLNGRPQYFYMGLDRLIGGRNEFSWEGGMYGWVRNSRSTPAGSVFTRFHEGIDIAPVARDEDGEPLDVVLAIDEGRVVYVNSSARRSDYGRYVVVEYIWDGSPFYVLHAHLAETNVREGEYVDRGDQLGILGYSGEGLDRARAHVHFEINLMLSEHFVEWRSVRHPGWPSAHGRFHGYNLVGVPPMEVLSRRYDDRRSIIVFLETEDAEITVLVPGGPTP